MSISESQLEFEALLDYLKQNCSYDLSGYKEGTLVRRVQYRMQQLEIENYGNYLQYLQNNSDECVSLFNTILINYSGFFRDSDSWDYLANQIIPQIITRKQSDKKIRVWSAGCASGQEVYTLLMLLAEALGIEQCLQRVQVFATDIDEDALAEARQASYSDKEVANIPSDLLSKYFEQTQQRYVFDSKLRRTIIFGVHDLTNNAPMSKIDLVVCRNVLIYFKPQTQEKTLVRFHFGLCDNGFLFLGNSEGLTNNKYIFTPVSLKHRIFAKGQNLTLQDHLLLAPRTDTKKAVNPLTTQIQMWKAAFLASPLAQLAVDRSGRLLLANEQANTLFNLNISHIGAQVEDLEIARLINPSTFINQLDRDRAKPSAVRRSRTAGSDNSHSSLGPKHIEWVTDNHTTYLNIYTTLISDESGKALGTNLTFIDVTRNILLEDEIERLNSALVKVTQELKETKEVLHTTTQQFDSTQKELESVHQEMQFRINL
ncbi:CheR family methyltransferase [Brasilonema octagenarum]|uniref:protein-glutamate O-methyltransferase n=1 Tax=Brasilonema octagenarum UFV-OR1 TaxID=417115 RepID=A0ABX1MDC5_9CYAN|nr:CheR family methyltransferase [Brasilonema octagenarum]NMF65100.1 chemotaxis protein CheR [Brasilonema octagenarum UFV-OR1]